MKYALFCETWNWPYTGGLKAKKGQLGHVCAKDKWWLLNELRLTLRDLHFSIITFISFLLQSKILKIYFYSKNGHQLLRFFFHSPAIRTRKFVWINRYWKVFVIFFGEYRNGLEKIHSFDVANIFNYEIVIPF